MNNKKSKTSPSMIFPNLWDDTPVPGIDLNPTGGTKAEYPCVLPSEDELHRFTTVSSGFGIEKMEMETHELSTIEGPPTLYVISERPNFREDSFFNALSKRYRVERLYMREQPEGDLNTPIGFIVDVTVELISTYSKSMIQWLQKYTTSHTIPLFLVGETEDLLNARRNCPFPDNTYIMEFKRPVNIRECIEKIKEILKQDLDEKPKKHILVVDDSIIFLKLVQRTLEKDYKVTAASSAFNAIVTLAKLSKMPDLIIIDYEMPDCDGMTLCKMIRGEERTKDVPVIFYTGNANTADIINVMPMVNGYLLKSQPIIALRAMLDDMFLTPAKKEEQLIHI